MYAYRTLTSGECDELAGYARRVPIEEIEGEDFNCNIRRYVDNAPPPEPHDVRAHLHGGVPKSEIDILKHFWTNYPSLRECCFQPRPGTESYLDFTPEVTDRHALASIVNGDTSVAAAHKAFLKTLETWWNKHLPDIEALAQSNGNKGNVYALRRSLLVSIEQTFADTKLLTGHQIRGAFARYVDELKADLKSVAASGWGPELIPDADILKSQFPEVLAGMETKRTQVAELMALFAAADEEDYEDKDDIGVLPSEQVKALKEDLKDLKATYIQHFKELKATVNDLFKELKPTQLIPKGQKKGGFSVKGTQSAPDFASAEVILSIAADSNIESYRIEIIRKHMQDGREKYERAQVSEDRLEKHKALENEVRQLKAELRVTEKKQDDLVAAAREKINPDEAREIIIERLHRTLVQIYESYLRADRRACIAALENLHAKYAITAACIEQQRDAAAAKLKGFLGELGYA